MTSSGGVPPDALRDLVREVLRDVLPTLVNGAAPPSGIPSASPASATPSASPASATPATGLGAARAVSRDGAQLQPVRLATDEELHAFVLRVVALAGNPKRRRDLLAGRLRFTLGLAGAPPADAAPPASTPAGHAVEARPLMITGSRGAR